MEEIRNAHKTLVGKPGRRWEVDIRMDRRETGWEVAGWMRLVQDTDRWRAVVNTVLKCGEFLDYLSDC